MTQQVRLFNEKINETTQRFKKLSMEDKNNNGEKIEEFARECIEVLIQAPDCQMLMKKFAKRYEEHFKKPLNRDQYGFKSLTDLFRAMPQTLEVGHKYINWDGLCYKRVVQLTESAWRDALEDREKYSLGSKSEEIEEFAEDCVKVLILAPECKLPYFKFRLFYELLFQRKVMASDYGFRRLLDLLKAVPETVEVLGLDIQLTEPKRTDAAEERAKYHPKLIQFEKEIVKLLKVWPEQKIEVTKLHSCYWRFFKRQLRSADFEFDSVKQMLQLMSYVIEVEGKKPHTTIKLLPQKTIECTEDEEEDFTCIVCMDRKPEVALVPCSHNNLCRACADEIYKNEKKCPVDRMEIEGIISLSAPNPINFEPIH